MRCRRKLGGSRGGFGLLSQLWSGLAAHRGLESGLLGATAWERACLEMHLRVTLLIPIFDVG